MSENPARTLELLGIEGDPERAVDILVGGPPCPTFSKIGRSKINSVRADLEGGREIRIESDLFDEKRVSVRMRQEHLDFYRHGDERNDLYRRFIEYAKGLKPLACLMENVPGFLNQAGTNHAAIVASELEGLGYEVHYTILNAADHGVPQWRERFFLVAIHRSIGAVKYRFPRPTHSGWRPDGLRQNRLISTKLVEGGGKDHSEQLRLFDGDRFHVGTTPIESGIPYVTAREAIRDLPPYDTHRREVLWTRDSEWAKPEVRIREYARPASTEYARFLRTWIWTGSPTKISGGFPEHHHRARHTMVVSGRDVRLFELMRPGDDYRDATRIARRLLAEACRDLQKRAGRPLRGDEIAAIEKRIVPPYPVAAFPHKWWKIDPDFPVRTLTAHLGVDSYSHIHYDRKQGRMITVQEAARLQSFPDRFVFRCGVNAAMRQIGNSVPPLVALSLARTILTPIQGANIQDAPIADSDLSNLTGKREPGGHSEQSSSCA